MPHITLDDLKDQLKIRTSDRDAELAVYVGGTERVMTYLVGLATPTAVTEIVTVSWSGKLLLAKRPIVSVASITPVGAGAAISSSTVIEDAAGGVVGLTSGCLPRGRYTVVYSAGHAASLDNMKLAGRIIGQHLWRTQNGGGGAPYPGQDEIVQLGLGYAVPRRALELLAIEATPSKVGGFA